PNSTNSAVPGSNRRPRTRPSPPRETSRIVPGQRGSPPDRAAAGWHFASTSQTRRGQARHSIPFGGGAGGAVAGNMTSPDWLRGGELRKTRSHSPGGQPAAAAARAKREPGEEPTEPAHTPAPRW